MGKIFKMFVLCSLALIVGTTGVMAQMKKTSFVALGDSIPFGFNLGEDNTNPAEEAFPFLMGMIGKGDVNNLGVPMWKTDDLLKAVEHDPVFRDTIGQADLITVNIGSNDLLQALHDAFYRSFWDSSRFSEYLFEEIDNRELYNNLERILIEIRMLSDAPVLLYNIYNPFQEDDPLYNVALHVLPEVNNHLEMITQQCNNDNVILIDAFGVFQTGEGDYVLESDIHPTRSGHQRLAQIGIEAIDKHKLQQKEEQRPCAAPLFNYGFARNNMLIAQTLPARKARSG
ncbi:lipolytic protein G-D-S-L family [Bacillus sp. H-16]|uniref:GDSL-type esterase/lipase family protein n=1 Tax=Alteribacter salitolerans TaxID=2912333 RepID=UPI00196415D1|nr:GDSL-type esterase/lipase family protein [Alteribacter salitolerans]MBM7096186.1 lipolytic protein G-D-S-L family [Alteribacter salitolerans]